MLLILLRHGIAEPADQFPGPDADRPLTARGQTRTYLACRGLWTQMPCLPAVVTSPKLRARETSAILGHTVPEYLGGLPTGLRSGASGARATLAMEIWPQLQEPPADQLVERIWSQRVAALVCVGHEPHLSHLASLLLGLPAAHTAIELKKSGALALNLEPASHRVTLLWHMAPAHLRALAPD